MKIINIISLLSLLIVFSLKCVTHIDTKIKYQEGMQIILDKSTGKFTDIIPADYKKEPYRVVFYNSEEALVEGKGYGLCIEKTKKKFGILPWVTKEKLYVEFDPRQPQRPDVIDKHTIDYKENYVRIGCLGLLTAVNMYYWYNKNEDETRN